MSAPLPVDVVLFDLGGVLVELGDVVPARELTGVADDDELRHRWLACRWVRDFERGACTPAEFAAGVVADWELPITPAEYLERFVAWPRGPHPEAIAVVADTRARVAAGCLSNTNALHSDGFVHGPLGAHLDHRFFSHELGLVKPDAAIFDAVATRLGLAPERIALLDDHPTNVAAARAAGWVGVQAIGPAGARAALVELGVLPAD